MMSKKQQANRVLANANYLPDEHSVGVYKMLMEVYPAFAKKLFENNELMKRLVMTGMNPMQILDYPICGKCETMALFNGYGKRGGRVYEQCTCVANKCGHTTVNPITLREWIKIELKHKAPADFIEAIEYAVDTIAQNMIAKYYQDNEYLLTDYSTKASKKMGIVDKHGNLMDASKDKPTLVQGHGKPTDKIDIIL